MITVDFVEKTFEEKPVEHPPESWRDQISVFAIFTCEHCGWTHERRAMQLAAKDRGVLSKVIIDFVPVFNHECATTSAAKARQG